MTDPATRHVIVLEPHHQGHRLMYLVAFAEHATRVRVRLTWATAAPAVRSEEFALRRDTVAPRVAVSLVEDPTARTGIDYLRALTRIAVDLQQRHPEAEILVPDGDKFLLSAALGSRRLDRRRMRLLVMRAPGWSRHPRRVLGAVAKLALMALASLRGTTVRVLEQSTPSRPDYWYGPWRAAPDPVSVRPAPALPSAARGFGRAHGDRRWIGVVGHVTRRKNLDLVLDAARRHGAPRLGVVVAGRIEPGEAVRCAPAVERFRAAGGQLVVLDTLLPDDELDACIAALDVVVLAHSSEGPSGILGKAAALGTPVIAAGADSLRSDVHRLRAGHWVPLRVEDLADAFALPLSRRDPADEMAGPEDFARELLDA